MIHSLQSLRSWWKVSKPGLSGVVLQSLQCFINRSFSQGFIVNLENYFPVLLFLLIGTIVGLASQFLGRVVGPHRPDAAKLSPYECGFEAF